MTRPPLELPPPGTAGHHDFTAELAERTCELCLRTIGYSVPFWFVTPLAPQVVHAHCLHRDQPASQPKRHQAKPKWRSK